MKFSKIFFALIFGFLLSTVLSIGAELPLLPTAVAVSASYAILSFSMPINGYAFFNFIDLTWEDGAKNMGGLQVTGYYAPISHFENIPKLYANPSTPSEEVTLDSSTTGFTFLIGKNFLKLYMTLETGKIDDEPQGEVDGQSFVHKAEIFYPGTKPEALAFASQINNSNMLFVFLESDGQRRVIGSEAFPARCKPKTTTGGKTADRKGITLEIWSYGYTTSPIYDGDIPLTPAA